MDRNPISLRNIACYRITGNRLAALAKSDKNVINSLYNNARLWLFLPYAAYQFVQDRFVCLGFRLLDKSPNDLQRGDFAWLGLIGSKTKRRRFVHRLEQRGIRPAQLERLVCPVGLSGIRGKQPATIAISLAAQLMTLAQHRGR